MNHKQDCILGIDTSNYKTSVAVIRKDKEILCDLRTLLRVKQGERGLRQSDALFQHLENLPDLIQRALGQGLRERIAAVACSQRPRPVENSYMPVFKAGLGFGKAVSEAMGVPFYRFSHQEGHIEAVRVYSSFDQISDFLCYHLSGGTCELLQVNGTQIKKIGGSKDLSFGQVLDRIGVKLGMAFPAGEEMDLRAQSAKVSSNCLKRIPADGLFFNLSGIETQCSRQIDKSEAEGRLTEDTDGLIQELFDRILQILIKVTKEACRETSIKHILFTGGVSSSRYISSRLEPELKKTGLFCEFGDQTLSQDNAVGIALLGGRQLWH